MAKAKTKKKKASTGRRRSVGKASLNPDSTMVKLAVTAVGFVLAPKINPLIDKVTGTMDSKIVGGAQTGVGSALLFMKLGKKKSWLEVVPGGLLAGAGAKRLLQALGVLNGIGGYQSVPVLGKRMNGALNGYGAVPVLGQYTTARSGQLNGIGGYQVPYVPAHKQVMGSTGSGLMNGSDFMD